MGMGTRATPRSARGADLGRKSVGEDISKCVMVTLTGMPFNRPLGFLAEFEVDTHREMR
jgi:hypothetical protein